MVSDAFPDGQKRPFLNPCLDLSTRQFPDLAIASLLLLSLFSRVGMACKPPLPDCLIYPYNILKYIKCNNSPLL